MRCLELFCGTKSFKKACPSDWEIISIDLLKKFDPDICVDIVNWDYKKAFENEHFDIIWASPPCRFFSIARNVSLGKYVKFHNAILTKELMKLDELNHGLPPVLKTFEIIEYFKPTYWFMENPAYGRLRDYIDKPSIIVNYCRFGFNYKKPTRIWTNKTELKDKRCNCKQHNKKHLAWDKINGTANRYKMPIPLIQYLIE